MTHHWKRPTELSKAGFLAAVSDCRKVFGDSPDLAGFDGTGAPIFASDRIVFNGRAPQNGEPFEVAIVEFDRHGRSEFFSHCKTLYGSYDLFVKASLIILSHHLGPRFLVSSDVSDDEWEDARQFVHSAIGIGAAFRLTKDA